MSDVIRLSDLVPAYVNYHGVCAREAAYDLHELMLEVLIEYEVKGQKLLLPEDLFWVGSATKRCKPYTDSLLKYFVSLISTGAGSLIYAYADSTGQKDVPAEIVCFSRKRFCEWVEGASSKLLESCEFLFSDELESNNSKREDEIQVFKSKELISIQNISRGLIEMLVEVDRAHRKLSKKVNPSEILRAVADIDLNDSPSKWYTALAELATATEVEGFRSNRRTLEKYVGK